MALFEEWLLSPRSQYSPATPRPMEFDELDDRIQQQPKGFVVEKTHEEIIVPQKLPKMPDNCNFKIEGPKYALDKPLPRSCSQRFTSIETKFVYMDEKQLEKTLYYDLEDSGRYICYNQNVQKHMVKISDITEESLFCKSTYSKRIADVSRANSEGIKFDIYNHYTNPKNHVLLLGLVPRCYEDAVRHFIECRKLEMTKKLEKMTSNRRLIWKSKEFRLIDSGKNKYFGPLYDGQLELFVLSYFILETQDLVNPKLTVQLQDYKKLSFLLGKLDAEKDDDLRTVLKYVKFVNADSLEELNSEMIHSKENRISLPLLFAIKNNYDKILHYTDKAYHCHWHNFMEKLGLHHYKCPHTYHKIVSMHETFVHMLRAYKRNCVNSNCAADVNVRDIFIRYPHFNKYMPEKVNRSLNDLLSTFSYHFAKYLFLANHYNRPLESRTVDCYLTKLHCSIKNLGLIDDPKSKITKEFENQLLENVNFLAFLNNLSSSRFQIPNQNNLSTAIQKFLENALQLELLSSQANAPTDWAKIEKTIVEFKRQKFRLINDEVFSEESTYFNHRGESTSKIVEMEIEEESASIVADRIERDDSLDPSFFDNSKFKYQNREGAPTVCVGCCDGLNTVKRYLILNPEVCVAFCTWCALRLNENPEHLPILLKIIEKKYKKPIFLDKENKIISYEKMQSREIGKKTYNRIGYRKF